MEKLYRQIGDEVREYTAEEYEQNRLDQLELARIEAERAQAEAEAAAAKQALLDKLGITEEEARLLLGGN
jgi:hypothetical protein